MGAIPGFLLSIGNVDYLRLLDGFRANDSVSIIGQMATAMQSTLLTGIRIGGITSASGLGLLASWAVFRMGIYQPIKSLLYVPEDD